MKSLLRVENNDKDYELVSCVISIQIQSKSIGMNLLCSKFSDIWMSPRNQNYELQLSLRSFDVLTLRENLFGFE